MVQASRVRPALPPLRRRQHHPKLRGEDEPSAALVGDVGGNVNGGLGRKRKWQDLTARFREAWLAREALEWRMLMLLRVAIESKAERTGQGGRREEERRTARWKERERGKEGGGMEERRKGVKLNRLDEIFKLSSRDFKNY